MSLPKRIKGFLKCFQTPDTPINHLRNLIICYIVRKFYVMSYNLPGGGSYGANLAKRTGWLNRGGGNGGGNGGGGHGDPPSGGCCGCLVIIGVVLFFLWGYLENR